jgi:DNA-binding MarR family transcriptional regulator
MSTTEIHVVLERLTNLLRSETRRIGSEHGLLPVQVDALHYLARCNRYSNTPQAVAEYLGTTKGTTSQSLNILEVRDLIVKERDLRDRRMVHLFVTAAGHRLLQGFIPAPLLNSTQEHFSEAEQKRIAETLRTLLMTCQRAKGHAAFGQCSTCRHHLKRGNNQFQCGLTDEMLSKKESQQICREHAT